jgi:hypothetical protein
MRLSDKNGTIAFSKKNRISESISLESVKYCSRKIIVQRFLNT